MRFNDMVVFITGGAKGLGSEMAKAFLAEGAMVAVNGRHEETVKRFQEQFKDQPLMAVTNDITDYAGLENTIEQIIQKWGRIDILINNAGIVNPLAPAEKLKKEDFDRTIDINVKGTFYVTQLVGRKMIEQKSGRIINISSQVGFFGEKGFLPYAISKSAFFVMTKELAYEWSRHGVTVCTLAPGFIKGGMNEGLIRKEAFVNFLSGKTPIGRMGTIEEVVSTILFLASKEARYINGETITMDGGMTGYAGEGLLDFIAKGKV
jgi:NAD(P)-dependent dehydrogenase (short-subunit alcohol dehydrogenase family)